MSLLPVPHMPMACHVSMISYSVFGTRQSRQSTAVSPSRTVTASMFHSALSTPEENGHRPLTTKQKLLILADEHPRVLARLRTLAQNRHDIARAPHRFVVADIGE